MVGEITHMHMFAHTQNLHKMKLSCGLLAKDTGTYAGQCLTTNSPTDTGAEG